MLSAVDENDEEIVEMLLKLPDIDVNKTGNGGWIPLLLAIAEKNERIVEILLKHPDIDVNMAGPHSPVPATGETGRPWWTLTSTPTAMSQRSGQYFSHFFFSFEMY